MNKKKRALSLGLAAAQLASLTAVVAPLTATAFAVAPTASNVTVTVTPASNNEYTYDGNAKTITVPGTTDQNPTAVTVPFSITAPTNYQFSNASITLEGTTYNVAADKKSFSGDLSITPEASTDGATASADKTVQIDVDSLALTFIEDAEAAVNSIASTASVATLTQTAAEEAAMGLFGVSAAGTVSSDKVKVTAKGDTGELATADYSVNLDSATGAQNGQNWDVTVTLTVTLSDTNTCAFENGSATAEITHVVTVSEAQKTDVTVDVTGLASEALEVANMTSKTDVESALTTKYTADYIASKITLTDEDGTALALTTDYTITAITPSYTASADTATVTYTLGFVDTDAYQFAAGSTASQTITVDITEAASQKTKISINKTAITAGDFTYTVAKEDIEAADRVAAVKTKIEGVVDTAITAATIANKDKVDFAVAVTEAAGVYTVKVTPTVKDVEKDSYELALAGANADDAFEYAVDLTKYSVTADAPALKSDAAVSGTAITLPNKPKDFATDKALQDALLAYLDTPTFGSDTLATTDYTTSITLSTTGNATIKVSPAATSLATFTEATLPVTYTFTKDEIADPAVKTGHTAAAIELPVNADEARVKEAVLAVIDYDDLKALTEGADYEITINKSALAAASANDTPNVAVTFKINDTDNYKYATEASDSVSLDVAVTATAALATLKPTFPADTTVYVDEATEAKVKAAIEALADFEPTFTSTPAGGGTETDVTNLAKGTDYELAIEYGNSDAALVTVKLTAAADTYVLADDAVPGNVGVMVTVAKPADVTTAVEITKDAPDADETVMAEVEELMTALGLTKDDDYTMTVTGVDASTVTTTDKTAVVTVELIGLVFDNGSSITDEAQRYTDTCEVNVAYKVVDTPSLTTELKATYSAADRTNAVELAGKKPESGAYELTAADKTAIKAAAIAIIKADVAAITADKFESTVTYGAVTGAVGAETVEATFTLTTAAQDEYTVKGGGTSVKVTVPVKYSGSTDVPGEDTYALNKASASNGSFSFTVGGEAATEAAEGDEVTIVTNPTRGYTLNKITVVNDDTDEEITVTSKKFTMPDASVTVTVTFKRASSSSGSSTNRPSGGSSSSSSSSSTTPSVSDSETVKEITSTTSGGTAKLDGVVIMTTDAIKSAADKDVNLEVKVDDDYTWNIDADKLSDKNSVLRLSVSSATVNETETAKIKKSTSAEDRNEKAFSVVADNLGSGATLKVKTVSKSTDTVQKFANLYKTNADGTLTFVAAAPIDKDGNAVLPITDKGTYTIVASTETKMAGDINNDCKVDLTDLTAMLTKYVNNTDPKSFSDFKLDHDNSGELSLSDLVAMLRDYSNGKL